MRIRVDRDLDGCLDRDEIDGGSDRRTVDPRLRTGRIVLRRRWNARDALPLRKLRRGRSRLRRVAHGSTGIRLAASGSTSPDTVVFTASGGMPTELGMLLQGTVSLPSAPSTATDCAARRWDVEAR